MKHLKRYMHSHNLSAHPWYELQQFKGEIFVQISKNFQKEVVLLYINKIKVFGNCWEQ